MHAPRQHYRLAQSLQQKARSSAHPPPCIPPYCGIHHDRQRCGSGNYCGRIGSCRCNNHRHDLCPSDCPAEGKSRRYPRRCLLLHQGGKVKLNPARMKPPCGINPIVRDLENHVAAVRRVALPRTLLCSPGLGAEASTSRKHTDGNRVFRVCGYKCIACTVAFVYTQALLAPLQNNSPNNLANFQKRSTN